MTKRSADRAEFLSDILTTAIEGGYSTLQIRAYRWYSPDLSGGRATPGPDNTANAYATVADTNDGMEPDAPSIEVGLDDIARGLKLILDGKCSVHETYVSRFRQANRENDAGYIDAYDADMILQAAAIGEVIYG